MEWGEPAAETVVREVAEETCLQIEIESLLGLYTTYRHVHPNGDVAQPVTAVFVCSPVGGLLDGSREESEDLRYFPLSAVPPLMNRHHDDAVADLSAGPTAVHR